MKGGRLGCGGLFVVGLLAAGPWASAATAGATAEEYIPVKLTGAVREYRVVRTEGSGWEGPPLTLRITMEGQQSFRGRKGWVARYVLSLPAAEPPRGGQVREAGLPAPMVVYFDFKDGQPFQVGWVTNPGSEGRAAFLFDPPLAVLPARMEVGASFRATTRLKHAPWWTWLTGTWWMAGWERVDELAVEAKDSVTVPAGRFETLRVTRRISQPPAPSRTDTEWRAPRVGLVQALRLRPNGSRERIELVRWTNP